MIKINVYIETFKETKFTLINNLFTKMNALGFILTRHRGLFTQKHFKKHQGSTGEEDFIFVNLGLKSLIKYNNTLKWIIHIFSCLISTLGYTLLEFGYFSTFSKGGERRMIMISY